VGLTNVFNGTVPCQPVVQVRHYPDVNARLTRLIDQPLYQYAFARRSNKNLIDKVLARQFQDFVYRSQHLHVVRLGFVTRDVHKSLEAKAEMTDALDVMAQSLPHSSCADNQDIARLDAAVVASVDHRPPDQPPRTNQHGCKSDGQSHDPA
jgi:hypothetical protein